jgi:hypothetical protein
MFYIWTIDVLNKKINERISQPSEPRAYFTYTKHRTWGQKYPRHISGTTAPRNKIPTATPIFEIKLFNGANADFLSRDLIRTGNQYGDGRNASIIS